MNKRLCLLTAFFLACATAAFAGETKIILLKDGTRLSGDLVGIENNVYILETGSLGRMRINGNNVASITAASAEPATSPAAPAPNDLKSKISSLQAQITSNPAAMANIQQLMNDPQILEAMQDPAFMAAVMRGDINAMQANPQFQKLINNPNMQNTIQKIQGQQ